jgi:hypothetical protein
MAHEKDAFHIAKLALLNVRLLADLEAATKTSASAASLVEARLRRDAIASPVSLLHQATFLQFAYVCLVWLWERAKTSGNESAVIQKAATRFAFDDLYGRVTGSRPIRTPTAVLRLVRNAISHGRVQCHDDRFVFADQGARESGVTELSLTWSQLGELSEAILFSMNEIVYPRDPEERIVGG